MIGYKFSKKINKIRGKINKIGNSIGGENVTKLWKAITDGGNSPLNFNVDSRGSDLGLRVLGKNMDEVWDHIQKAFDYPSLTPDGRNGFYFEIGEIRFNWYPYDRSYNSPAISIGRGTNVY